MIDNSKCCQEKIFEKWKYAVRAMKIGDQLTDLQKTQAVSGLLRFNQSASVVLQKKALNKFKINSVVCRHQIKFMANCLSTKLGHLQKFHSTWKNMPEKLDKNKINNVSIFERKLVQLCNKVVQVNSFRILKGHIWEGDSSKKLICNALFRKTRGLNHNMFLKMHEYAQNLKDTDKVK